MIDTNFCAQAGLSLTKLNHYFNVATDKKGGIAPSKARRCEIYITNLCYKNALIPDVKKKTEVRLKLELISNLVSPLCLLNDGAWHGRPFQNCMFFYNVTSIT